MAINWPQWGIAGAQALQNSEQQQFAFDNNQQTLANSLGMQGQMYDRIMGTSNYMPQALGYGYNTSMSAQGQSPYSTPQNGPQNQPTPFGQGAQDWWFGPQSIYGQLTGQQPRGQQQGGQAPQFQGGAPQPGQPGYRPGPQGGPQAKVQPGSNLRAPGQGVSRAGASGFIPNGQGGYMPDVPANRGPQYQSLPSLTGEINQGYADRTRLGMSNAEGLQRDMMNAYGQGTDQVGNWASAAGEASGAGYGALGQGIGEQGSALAGSLAGGYQDRFNRNISRLQGLGAQENYDIRQNYQEVGAVDNARLAQSGLGGTTVGSTMALGRQREMSRDLGGLGERLRREITGYDTQLSGEALRSMQNQGNQNINRQMGIGMGGLGAADQFRSQGLGMQGNMLGQGLANQSNLGQWATGFGADISAQQLGNQYGMGQSLFGMDQALTRGMTNTMEGVSYPYPQGGMFDPAVNILSANAARPSGGQDNTAAYIEAGVGLAGLFF